MRSCLLSVTAILALACAVQADDVPRPKMVTKVFSVADLVTPLSDFGDMETMLTAGATAQQPKCRKKPATIGECGEKLTKLVTGMVRPHSWNTMDGPGSVDFFEIGCALVVKNSPDVVQEVNDLLDALRRLQKHSVCSEARLVKVPVVTQNTPIIEGGSQGKPVPFTQCIQAPDVQTETIKKAVMVPSDGTVVLGGWKEKPICPVFGKVPHVGLPGECEVIVLATVRGCRGKQPAAIGGGERCHQVIRLRNVAATDAAQTLTKYVVREKSHTSGPVVVEPDPATNTILVSAGPGTFQQLVQILERLDANPPQVMIQTLIAQVPAGFLSDIGFTDDTPDSPVMALTSRELNILSTQIRHGLTRGDVDILSRPQLCVADNQTGTVQVGQQYPYVATNLTDDKGVVTQKIGYEHVGLTLRVTPRTTPDGKVLLRVEPSLTSVAPAVSLGNGMSAPAFNIQTMQATVLTTDGRTVVIRGPIESTSREHPDDGPFTALAKRAAGPIRREMILILTPHIVRDTQPADVPSAKSAPVQSVPPAVQKR